MRLCECEKGPLRDATSPTRRFWCQRCHGATPYGRRLSLEETGRLVAQALSLLEKLLTDLTVAHEACYGLHSAPVGAAERTSRGSGHSDPTGAAAAGRRADSAQYAVLAAQWVKTATAMLHNADQAAGMALYTIDPHHGPTDPPAGHWWERPITADTPAAEVPTHLRDVHAALLARRARGEP